MSDPRQLVFRTVDEIFQRAVCKHEAMCNFLKDNYTTPIEAATGILILLEGPLEEVWKQLDSPTLTAMRCLRAYLIAAMSLELEAVKTSIENGTYDTEMRPRIEEAIQVALREADITTRIQGKNVGEA